ncbi:MAG: purine-binding chemotaxis protein CheW [Nitrospirae bacterium]|nr:purine-binding chemotaxis protein CheW [Nitrospirota bacterium]
MEKLKKFAVFRIGEQDFGIEVIRVVEILNMQKTHTIPELPDFISGVITVRGEVIPLLDLRKRFNVKSPEEEGRIIIVKYDSEKIGLLVDDIKEIISFGTEEIITPPSIFKGVKKKYLSGLGKKNEGIIILLNIDDLLTSEEKIFLKNSERSLEENAGSEKPP